MKGEDKVLKVKDLGPYTYIEQYEKVDVTFNENYTISYRVSKISFYFACLDYCQFENNSRKIERINSHRKSLRDTNTTK